MPSPVKSAFALRRTDPVFFAWEMLNVLPPTLMLPLRAPPVLAATL
jgi:hypothetical protein